MPEPPTIRDAGQPKVLPVSPRNPVAPKSNKNTLILVAAVVLVIVALAGVFVLTRQGGADLSTPPKPVVELQGASKPETPGNSAAIVFSATNAKLHGTKLQLEWRGGQPHIGYWNEPSEWISWDGVAPRSGKYKVSASLVGADGDTELMVEVGSAVVSARVLKADNWENYSTVDLGLVEIKQAGAMTVNVRAKTAGIWNPINLYSVQLTPVESSR